LRREALALSLRPIAHLHQHLGCTRAIRLARHELLIPRHVRIAQRAREPSGLEGGESRRRLAEVGAGGRPRAAQARSPVHRVQVQLEDPRLAERALHLDCVEQLTQLARGGPLSSREQRPRQLLRDRAAAAPRAAFLEVGEEGGNRVLVVACVLPEPLVFGGEHGRGEVRAHRIGRDPRRLAVAGDRELRAARRLATREAEPAVLQGFGAEPADLEALRAPARAAAARWQRQRSLRLHRALDARVRGLGHRGAEDPVHGPEFGGRQPPREVDRSSVQPCVDRNADVVDHDRAVERVALAPHFERHRTELHWDRGQVAMAQPARRAGHAECLPVAHELQRAAARSHRAAVEHMRRAGQRGQAYEPGDVHAHVEAGELQFRRPRPGRGREDAERSQRQQRRGDDEQRSAGKSGPAPRHCSHRARHVPPSIGVTTVIAHHGPPPYCDAQNHADVSVHRPSSPS